jgi:diguanylate cyclase (GGDEF)-like protein
LEIPCVYVRDPWSRFKRLLSKANKVNNNKIKVLLIEDDPAYTGLLRRTLSKEKSPQFDLESASGLQAGLERLGQGGTDVILLDLSLPDSQGLDTFHRVHTQAPAVPILILSGCEDEKLALEAVAKGAQDYLVKGQVDGKMLSRVMRYAIERKRAEEALAEQAIRDSLTNLFNRRYFNHRMEEEIAKAVRNKTSLAILLCDLDHFKIINDTRGHHTGDEVLKAVARCIQEATRGTDLVFRWGGDEIVVVLSEATREGILTAGERIRRGVRTFSEQAYLDLDLDLSIGVSIYPEHGSNVDELIRLADWALYIAKKGGDKIHIGEEEYQLDEHAIKVVFQPVMDVRSNEILGYEALSRDAQDKVSILELFGRYQAIGQLNELKRICFKSQLKAASELGLKRVFINVDFNVLSQLEVAPKPPNMEVILEISELEALHDIENHLKMARKWREGGYKFAIDDFGAGYISLPFIAQLIPDYIKVDRSTILQAVSSEKFRAFLRDLVLALQNYVTVGIIAEGIETVAERIETENELQVVKDLGIYLVQGFLLGKPEELH